MKKTLAIILALIMCIGMSSGVYAAKKTFTDVKETDWFYSHVMTAVELGLVNGKSETTYAPNDKLTYAEAIKLAACMNQLYTLGSINIGTGNPWYIPYAEYCYNNDIITKEYNYTENATRAGYMEIFANALPDEGLKAINFVADNSIPDVPSSNPYAEGVYKLYRAGILQGVDAAHNCSPNNNITRSEVAAILTRMMDEDQRVKFTLGEEEKEEEEEKKEEQKKEEAVEELKFTKHPIGGTVYLDTTIATNVTISGGKAPYTYQWMYNSGDGWKPVTSALGKVSGEDEPRVTIKSDKPASYKIRCDVTDANGNKASSNETDFIYQSGYTKLTIVEEPSDAVAMVGGIATATVKVEGGQAPYKYLWVSKADGNKWYSLANALNTTGGETETISMGATKAYSSIIRCTITDANGQTVQTKEVEIVFSEPANTGNKEEVKEEVKEEATPLVVEQQPVSASVGSMENASFSVKVSGGTPPYKYTWFYEYETKKWKAITCDVAAVAGEKTDTLNITNQASINLNLRCLIKDSAGQEKFSDTVTFTVKAPQKISIETQPVDTTCAPGEDAVLSVKAKDGIGEYTYQWQMSIGPSWVRISDNDAMSGTTTDTLTLKYTAGTYIDVRCVVTDESGTRAESDGVRVTFE